MYGWRAKIGFMLPSSCLVYEQEFLKITAGFDGVIGCPARLLIDNTDAAGLLGMNRSVEMAARELATVDPDVAVYMCTSGSFLEGQQGEEALRQKIAAITHCPVMSTTQAVLEALRHFGARRVAMLTPYNEDLTLREVAFLQTAGFEVVDYHYRDIVDNLDRGAQTPEATFYYARKLNLREADAIFLSCGNIRTLEIVSLLERHTGKAVVASSLATTWMALGIAGVQDPVQGFGRLLAEPWKA